MFILLKERGMAATEDGLQMPSNISSETQQDKGFMKIIYIHFLSILGMEKVEQHAQIGVSYLGPEKSEVINI